MPNPLLVRPGDPRFEQSISSAANFSDNTAIIKVRSEAPLAGQVIAARYRDGKLEDVQISAPLTAGSFNNYEAPVRLTYASEHVDGDTYKVFMVNNLTAVTPVLPSVDFLAPPPPAVVLNIHTHRPAVNGSWAPQNPGNYFSEFFGNWWCGDGGWLWLRASDFSDPRINFTFEGTGADIYLNRLNTGARAEFWMNETLLGSADLHGNANWPGVPFRAFRIRNLPPGEHTITIRAINVPGHTPLRNHVMFSSVEYIPLP